MTGPEDRVIHAPGKLVLVGEYAVLDGAPAIALALDHGVRCRVGPAPALELRCPGDQRFVRAALDHVKAPPARYVFQDWNPVDLPGKPGFGGSAAATVAAVLAGGGDGAQAYQVHATIQGGGSGVDVASSLHGGMIRYQAGRVEQLRPLLPVVVYSGKASATLSRIRLYRDWQRGRREFVAEMASVVEQFTRQPIEVLRVARQLLLAMARGAGILYETPSLHAMARLAEELGGAAKPSGAGGGDCGVALLPDPGVERAFQEACGEMGLRVLPYTVVTGAGEAPVAISSAVPPWGATDEPNAFRVK